MANTEEADLLEAVRNDNLKRYRLKSCLNQRCVDFLNAEEIIALSNIRNMQIMISAISHKDFLNLGTVKALANRRKMFFNEVAKLLDNLMSIPDGEYFVLEMTHLERSLYKESWVSYSKHTLLHLKVSCLFDPMSAWEKHQEDIERIFQSKISTADEYLQDALGDSVI